MKSISTRNLLFLILVLIFSSFENAVSQIPVLKVRFANPTYNATSQTYSLDVEFQSNTANQKLFGMNVRFFYDDVILEYQSMNNFVSGYVAVAPNPASITTSTAAGGAAWFGFPTGHPFEYCNGAIQLTGTTTLYLSTTGWTRIFTINFHVDDPASLNIASFCPSVIWDLELNPANGGWLNGDDGVVMTVVAAPPAQSAPTTENVVQHNWQYNASGLPYGVPASTNCISTIPFIASVSSSTTAVCAGSTNGTATVSASGGTPPYTYSWNTNPATTMATATGLGAGTYSVTVTDALNLTAVASTTIASNPLPLAYSVTGTGSYCSTSSGLAVGLGGSQTGINYTMNPGSITLPGTGNAIAFGYQLSGTYTISAVNTATGCVSSMNGSAIITSIQPVPVSVSITPNSTSPLSSDEEIVITASPVYGGSTPAYQWKVNGNNAGSNNPVFTYTPDDQDLVQCILTSSLTCVSNNPATSNTLTMVVVSVVPQITTVSGQIGSGISKCYNALQTITVAGSGTTFNVQNGGSATVVAGQNISLLPGTTVQSGGYFHAYITTDNTFCNQQPIVQSPLISGASPNENNDPGGFKIFPNPASDQFSVTFPGTDSHEQVEVSIINLNGQTILSETVAQTPSKRFDVSNLPSGLYLVRINSFSQRLVINR